MMCNVAGGGGGGGGGVGAFTVVPVPPVSQGESDEALFVSPAYEACHD